jgi:hypothetical protein
VWAALVVNLGTTTPKLTQFNLTAAVINSNLTASAYRFACSGKGLGTGQTSLPASFTPSINTAGAAMSAGAN